MRPTTRTAGLSVLLLCAATLVALLPLMAPPSQADVTDAFPAAVGNWPESNGVPTQPTRVTFTTTTLSPSGTPQPPVPVGADVLWQRSANPNDTFHSIVDQNTSAAQDKPSTMQDFSNVTPTNGQAGDGPANPGQYDVILQSMSASGAPATVFHFCRHCVSIVAAGPPELTGAAPFEVAAGVASQVVTFRGDNLARGAVFHALTPDGGTDTNITFTRPTGAAAASTAITPGTALPSLVTVAPGTPPGPRDVEVLNTDNQRGLCEACLTVLDSRWDSVNPTGALNTNTDTTNITFTGPPGVTPGNPVPVLKFVGETDDLTRPFLRLNPTLVTSRFIDGSSIAADFDLRGAAPGAYQPALVSVVDGSTLRVCGCRFTVQQATPPSLTAVNPSHLFRNGTTAVTLTGYSFTQGTTAIVSGGGVLGSESRLEDSGTVHLKLTVQAGAVPGVRDVVARTTDGQKSAVCRGCITVEASSFASPTPSPSPRPSPTRSPSSSPSPSEPPLPTRSQLAIFTSTPDIHPNDTAVLNVEGTADEDVLLRCYSRPSTTYQTARSGTLDSSGAAEFRIQPGTNTRCYASYGNDSSLDSRSLVISVHTTLSLSGRRLGVRYYEFRGRTLPRIAGQLVTLYRISGSSEVRTGSAKTDADGIWSLTRQFTGNGTFPFIVRTGQTYNNAPGQSQKVSVRVY